MKRVWLYVAETLQLARATHSTSNHLIPTPSNTMLLPSSSLLHDLPAVNLQIDIDRKFDNVAIEDVGAGDDRELYKPNSISMRMVVVKDVIAIELTRSLVMQQ